MTDGKIGLLIGGTSHTGKTTLARQIGKSLGWAITGTDQLGRHPGRPWPQPLQRNVDFFTALSDQVVYEFLELHHHNMWPLVQRIIAEQGRGFIVEGSALRPAFMASQSRAEAVFLFAPHDFLRGRIARASGYHRLPQERQLIVDKFTMRSLTDNDVQLAEAHSLGITCLDVSIPTSLSEFAEDVSNRLGG